MIQSFALHGLVVLCACALAAILSQPTQPTAQQRELLTTFRNEFVHVTPGQGRFPASFMMGGTEIDQQPRREVTLDQPFWIARFETTQELYQAVSGDNPSRWKGPRNSVEMTSFDDALAFCRQATRLMRQLKLIDDDQEIRLPSEAQWEYAARAGTSTAFSFGDDPRLLDEHAWHAGNAAGNDPPVGQKKPNPWGLYDVHGYLWEWCADHGHPNYQMAPLNSAPWINDGDENRRVIRGGSWKDSAGLLGSANRSGEFRTGDGLIRFQGGVDKSLKDDAVGFRCLLAARRP